MKQKAIFFLAISVLFFAACSGTGNPDPGQLAGTGTIVGKAVYRGSNSHDGISIILEQTDGLNSASLAVSVGRSTLARSVTGSTVTAGDGLYRFDNVLPGTYTIYAISGNAKEKAVTTNLTVESGNLALANELVLNRVGNLTGRVKVNGETGNAGILVFIASTSYMAMTDGLGFFTISDVPVNSAGYQIIIMKGNHITVWGTFTVTAESTKDLGTKNLVIEENGFVGIQWKGSLDSAPVNPGVNWAYYDIIQKKSFIWDGSAWRMIAQDGDSSSTNGQEGSSIVWKGALSSAPEDPKTNWAYYDITQKASFIWDGNVWHILSQDGFGTPTFMRVAELSSWLIRQNGGNTVSDPIFTVYAGNETPRQLYDALNTAKKYVALDLSLSEIMEFTSGDEAGRKYIVTLNLPKKCITALGTQSDPVFKHFDNLESVTGGMEVSFGAYAFAGLTSLRSVSLTTDKEIGEGAFMDCINLSSVEIPRMGSISEKVFEGCTSLVSVSFPNVNYINSEAFTGCTSLILVQVTNASGILSKAFKDCTSLSSILVGNLPFFQENVFQGTAKFIRTITVYVSSEVPESVEALKKFGANSSVDYYWDKDSPYRTNLTVVLGVVDSQDD